MAERRLSIRNLRNIRQLDFAIPEHGVYVLSGSNGSGKTTLLAALYRIGHKQAFAESFKTSVGERNLDIFSQAEVTYRVESEEVTYKYVNTRWTPTPKRNSDLLKKMGYSTVLFIAANARRIEPTTNELRTNRIRPAAKKVRDELKSILRDPSFDNLKVINTKRGTGNEAFLIQKGAGSPPTYYSEKNFSLGELCVLKLVVRLQGVALNSLILIDEIEMALHPRAQEALLRYLERTSKDRELTIIFSSHSASLIKRAGRGSLMFLYAEPKGEVHCLRGAYPAQVLGDIAIAEEVQPDFLFFVEDYPATFLLEELLALFKSTIPAGSPTPYHKTVPVGGFEQVLTLLRNSDQIFSDTVRRHAFLDDDVRTESLKDAESRKDYRLLTLFEDSKEQISYLPCTPEKGIVDLLDTDPVTHGKALANRITSTIIDFGPLLDSEQYRTSTATNPRVAAKKRLSFLCNEVARKIGRDHYEVVRILSRYYADTVYGNQLGKLKGMFNPIFRSTT